MHVLVSILAVGVVLSYYGVVWLRVGRDPKEGIIVVRYEPPSQLSPAMARYVWKQGFDDRAFWACILSLVAKGCVSLVSSSGNTYIHRLKTLPQDTLSREEQALLSGIGRKRLSSNMIEPETIYSAERVAAALRLKNLGRWFRENREYVIAGCGLSLLAVYVVANPQTVDDFGAFALGLAMMAPGAFYLIFLLLRIRDLLRAARGANRWSAVRRTLILAALLLPCIAGIAVGSVVLASNFSCALLLTVGALVGLNLAFLHLMKAPTKRGRKLLDEIEGFRLFLSSVEKLPLDRSDAPSDHVGLYERYLPYAVALEVEQCWCDRSVALASTAHAPDLASGTHSFYLGMWNDEPVEIVLGPLKDNRGRY